MLSAIYTAIQTLTRIPVPSAATPPDSRTIAWSGVFYPAVGALLGVMAMASHRLLFELFPRSVVMLIVLTLWILLTGGFHEDGLADTADAFGSQRSREDILRVLKDSRIGSYGAIALVLSLLLRWQALTLLPLEETSLALMASQVLPRAGIVTLAFGAGRATSGLGGSFAASLGARHAMGAWVLALAVLAPYLSERPMVVTLLMSLCLGIVFLLGAYFRRKIGGVTGDCLGAGNQLQEIAVLLLLLGFFGA